MCSGHACIALGGPDLTGGFRFSWDLGWVRVRLVVGQLNTLNPNRCAQ